MDRIGIPEVPAGFYRDLFSFSIATRPWPENLGIQLEMLLAPEVFNSLWYENLLRQLRFGQGFGIPDPKSRFGQVQATPVF